MSTYNLQWPPAPEDISFSFRQDEDGSFVLCCTHLPTKISVELSANNCTFSKLTEYKKQLFEKLAAELRDKI